MKPQSDLATALHDLRIAFLLLSTALEPIKAIDLDREAGYALLRELREWTLERSGRLKMGSGVNELTFEGIKVRWPL